MSADDRGPEKTGERHGDEGRPADKISHARGQRDSEPRAPLDATRTASDELLLGRLAFEAGLITEEQLKEALAHRESRKVWGKEETGFGEYLLSRQWITAEALAGLKAEQARRAGAVFELPRYEIRALVGQGATALVYSAWDRELRRLVALKLLRESSAVGEMVRTRFRREAQIAAGLSHPNLVAVYDAGEVRGQLYLVMELVEGRPLGAVIRDAAVEGREKLVLLEKAARGVAAAHARGIVHRDLKPANILVTIDQVPKVSDFGLAHLVDSSTELTKTGSTLGTPLYMSPEQVEGRSSSLSPATDVYALGAILYEIVVGRPPHAADTPMELYHKIVHDEPVAPSRLVPGLPADLETIILKALDKVPLRRYSTAESFAEDLRLQQAGEPIHGSRLPWGARLFRKAWRHRGAVVGALAAVALALGAFWALASSFRKKARLESAISRALRFEEEKRFVEAITLLRSALDEEPQNEQAHASLGRIEAREARDRQSRDLENRKRKQAETMLEAVRPALGEAEHYLYDPNATSEGLAIRLGAARSRIRQAIEISPGLPLGHTLLGRSFEIGEEDEAAEAATEKALLIDPDYAPARYQLGRLHLGRALKRMIGATPEDLELKRGEARKLAERAAREIGKALTSQSAFNDNLDEKLARTMLTYLTGTPEQALEQARAEYQQFSSKEGREEFLWIGGLASSGIAQIRYFDQALEIRPNWTLVRLARAGARLAAGEPDSAMRDCEAVLRLHPDDPDAILNLSVAFSLRGDADRAIAGFDRVLALRPGDVAALYNRALSRRQKGDLGGALEDLTQTLALRPDFAPALNNRGTLRLGQSDVDGALSDFDRAIRENPGFAEALNNRGSARFRKGNLEGALSDLGEALRRSPGFAEAHYNRSLVWLKKEELGPALEDLRQAIEARPSWSPPYVLRAQVRSIGGDFPGARQDARRALDLGVTAEDRRALEALHLDEK
jgi:serine/threonine-protein kinase